MELCATLRKEKEEVEQASARLKIVIIEVMSAVIEEEYRAYHPFEEGLMKVKAGVQELQTKIVDLEARFTPATPPEEMVAREEVTRDAITTLEDHEAECLEQYNQASQVWN